MSFTVRQSINEALALLPMEMRSAEVIVLMLAIGLQESRLIHRRQLVGDPPQPTGPAKGLWQFELYGGCRGVVNHPASRYWMAKICEKRGVAFKASAIWNGIETDDILAAAAARLLIFTDPQKLPNIGDEKSAWNLYMRTWCPGKPHKSTWPEMYRKATQLL